MTVKENGVVYSSIFKNNVGLARDQKIFLFFKSLDACGFWFLFSSISQFFRLKFEEVFQ